MATRPRRVTVLRYSGPQEVEALAISKGLAVTPVINSLGVSHSLFNLTQLRTGRALGFRFTGLRKSAALALLRRIGRDPHCARLGALTLKQAQRATTLKRRLSAHADAVLGVK